MIPLAHLSPQLKRHLVRFRVSLCFTMGRPFSPQNCPFPRGIWTPYNTLFPGPTQVLNPNGSSIGAAVFAALTSVTDSPTDSLTDHATRSVTIGHNYVCSTAMRPKNGWLNKNQVREMSRLSAVSMFRMWQ